MGVSIGGSLGPIRVSVPLSARKQRPVKPLTAAQKKAAKRDMKVIAWTVFFPITIMVMSLYWIVKYLMVMPFVWMARGTKRSNAARQAQPTRQYRPGDIANGYVLTSAGKWVPVR